MTILANVLVGLAALLTAFAGLLVADARHTTGPDTMGFIVVPLLLAPRWLALSGALLIAARRGGMAWVHPARGWQGAAALAWMALAGIASFGAVLMAYGPHSRAFRPWAWALTVIVPAVVAAAAAVLINGSARRGSARTWRLAAGLVSLVVALGGLAMFRVDRADRLRADAARAADDAARARWLEEQRGALASLSPEAPLRDWLPWLNVSVDDLREPALAAVRARPTLERDLAAMLRGEEGPLALRFMWLWMPDPPPGLAEPALTAIAALPAWAERYLADPPRPAEESGDPPPAFPPEPTVDLSDMAQAAIVIADKYRASGLDFATPIRALAETLGRHAKPESELGSDLTYQPRGYLDTWLEQQAARGTPGAGSATPR
jgi:hypothetical protein